MRQEENMNFQEGTKDQLETKITQNSKFQHQKTYQRVKKQIKDLELELSPDQFQISILQETKQRIILKVTYFVKNQFLNQNHSKQVRKDYSLIKKQEIPPQNNKFSTIIPYFQQQTHQTNDKLSKKDQSKGKYVIFTCIIEFDLYPFSPPYIFLTSDNVSSISLGLNDFRNIIEDLFEDIDWFPIYGLFDVLVKLPYFVSKLLKNQQSQKSSYYYPKPFRKSDISLYAYGLKLHQTDYYDSKDALIGKYLKKIIGVSFQNLIIFKKINDQKLTINKVVKLKQVSNFKIQENDKRTKFILKTIDKKQIKYKFLKIKTKNENALSYQNPLTEDFINWMKICLFNSQIQKLKCHPKINQARINKITQTKQIKSRKIHNLSNQSSFFTNSKQTRKLESPQKQEKSLNLIEEQEIMSKILQSLDLLMSSQKYRKYQKDTYRNQIQEIFLQNIQTKRLPNQHSEQKLKIQQNEKPDFVENQYKKLIKYKKDIENERKRIFKLM